MLKNPLHPISFAMGSESAALGFTRHRGPVTGVAMIPGSRQIVTSAYDGAVALFDTETGRVELLGYHLHLVNRVVVSDDGRRAASCSSDYTTCIWDLTTRRPERVLRGHSDDVEDFLFIGGTGGMGDDLGVSASRDHRILIWNLATGNIERVLEGHEKDVLSLGYHDGRIYSSGDDKTLRVWDLATGRLLSLWGPFENETDTCAIDPLHHRAVLGCDDGCVRVFDTESGSLVREIAAHSSGIKKVSVSPASGDILSSAYDQKVLIWDAQTLEQKLRVDKRPSAWERSLTFSPDGRLILAGTFDGTVLLWEAATGELIQEVGDQATEAGNACFNDIGASDEGDVVLVSDDGYLRLGHLDTESAYWTAREEPASGRMLMNAATLDGETARVAAGSHDQKLHLFHFDRATGTLADGLEVKLGEGPINSVRFAHHPGYEGEAFVACYSSAIVRVAPDGSVRGKLHLHEGAVKALRLHPTKEMGVSCGADGLLLSWTFAGEVVQRFLGHTAIINDVDLAPSGERLASVSRDFSLKIYELATGRLLHSVPLGKRSLKSVCFVDEDVILVGDYWGSVIRVELPSETVTRRWIAANGISALGRSGPHVVATSYDGVVYRLDPADLTVLQTLRGMQQRLLERAA
ncbi:MAG TPA: WD40 repeat domain-containing protein [Thermoanaerobaculia bacterium]|nr:WD40 repeat domain-containing protein [Thermoanaerobaculia bacterium]